MRILTGIDIHFNPFGGSPLICDDWYSLLEKDHEVLFLTMQPFSKKRWWKMKNVHFLSTGKTKDVDKYPKYIKELTKEINVIVADFNPDIIHMQHINFGLSRVFADLQIEVPKIGICHGTDTQVASSNAYFKSNLKHIADNIDYLVFPAENMAKDFFKIYKNKKDYSIIHHGLPKELFTRHKAKNISHELKLLYAGRLNHYKGADIAVKAMTVIDQSVHLDIIGDEDEKNYVQKIKKIIKKHNLHDRVRLSKSISRHELWKKFSDYDAILIPSRSLEAFSLTAIEAQARGLPVIYGNGGGIVNVVGDSGIIIKDNKPKTLAKIIKKIKEDPRVLDKIRKKGYKNSRKYKIDKQIKKLINISSKIIKEKKRLNMKEIRQRSVSYFDLLWKNESSKLRSGDVEPAIMKDGKTVPVNYCVSTIARLKKQAGGDKVISAMQNKLADHLKQFNSQFIYPEPSMHISLVGCTQREDSLQTFNDGQIRNIINVCTDMLSGEKAVDIQFIGIGLIGNQVFLQGVSFSKGWELMREKLADKLTEAGESPITYSNQSPIHMNFLRIIDISTEQQKLIFGLIKQNRTTDFGKVRFDSIDLVTTDFVLSDGNVDLIKEFKLE